MASPPAQYTWSKEVDKLKNRLSLLSQSSLEEEDPPTSSEKGEEEPLDDVPLFVEEDREGVKRRVVGQGERRSSFEKRENKDQRYDFFFYGTLMHPTILTRVLGHSNDDLKFQDAILKGFVRHHVRSVDYPAIIPSLESGKLLGRDLEADEACVRGTYVSGLTKVDVLALDAFEGDEYARLLIKTTSSNPYLLTPLFSPPLLTPDANETPMLPTPLSSPYFQNVPVKPSILTLSTSCTLGQLKRVQGLKRVEMKVGEVQERAEKAEEGFAQVEGWVYVWREEVGRLEKKIWDFESFLTEKSQRWTGQPAPTVPDRSSPVSNSTEADFIQKRIDTFQGRSAVAERDESEYAAVDELRERLNRTESGLGDAV